MTMLTQLERIPNDLLDVSATELHRIFPGPTLLHLQGRRHEPLFISVLLHGNEDTGLIAIQSLLKKYAHKTLPRAVSIFFGNISAAKLGLRRLETQPDYNRIWPGAGEAQSAESMMMASIVDTMVRRDVFASVDIHNNSGHNPHFACLNTLQSEHLQLATLFSRTVVYFLRPLGVQSMAFSKHCPAVTLECGKAGDALGNHHAFEFLDACVHLSEIPKHQVATHDIDLFHTVARVLIPGDITFSFADKDADLNFEDDIEQFNFCELPIGASFGAVRNAEELLVIAEDEQGRDVTKEYFCNDHKRLTIKKSVMPSMLTMDERIIRQDCLCYLMERIHIG